jgi:hypothetical protein
VQIEYLPINISLGSINGTLIFDDGMTYPNSFQLGISEHAMVIFKDTVNGNFEIDVLPGIHNLYIKGDSFASTKIYNITVEPNTKTILSSDAIVLEKIDLISGYAKNDRNSSVSFSNIFIGNKITGNGVSLESNFSNQMVTSNKHGIYELKEVSEYLHMYIVAEKFGVGRSVSRLVTPGRMDLMLVPFGDPLEGTITCGSVPVPSVIKVESLPDKSLVLYVSTHSNGFYRFDNLTPGNYRISVIPLSSVCGMPTGTEVASQEVTVDDTTTDDGSIDVYNNPPVADAGEDQTIHNNHPVTLDAVASSGDIGWYDWFELNLETGEFEFVESNIDITVAAPTNLAFYILIVTDYAGAQSMDFTTVMYETP